MNKYIKCINYLITKKTHEIVHHDKSFFQHLINVYNTLRKWECEEDVRAKVIEEFDELI